MTPMSNDLAARESTGPARVIALGCAIVLVVGALASDRFGRSANAKADDGFIPVAAQLNPATSKGSLWFCPLVGDATDGPGSLVVTLDPAPRKSAANVSIVVHSPSGQLARVSRTQTVPEDRYAVVDLLPGAVSTDLPSLAATIEVDQPAVTVSATVPGRGSASTPTSVACSSVVSTQWWLGDGTTVLGSDTSIAIYNPFPESALIDLDFVTERGAARPTGLQGLAISAGSLRIIDLAEHVRRRETIATRAVARAGRVVLAGRTTINKTGATASVGAPNLAKTWFFPAAVYGGKRTEQYVFVNPATVDVTVTVTATLNNGDSEPFAVTVPASGAAVLNPAEDNRVPADAAYALTATADSNVLVTRTVKAPSAKRQGLVSQLGFQPASRWVLDGVTPTDPGKVAIFNPYDIPTNVVVASSQKKTVTVPAGAVLLVDVAEIVAPPNATGGLASIRISSADAPVVAALVHDEKTADPVGTGFVAP
jgi:Family of unknown function (DUF5719)